MIIISRTEMLSAADYCDNRGQSEQADAWRRYAAECATSTTLADRIVGRLSIAVILLAIAYAMADPAESILVAFGEAYARWLL